MEVEAVESVYGDDCIVLARFPPHLHIHIKPYTAQVHSMQFVEATIEIRASEQYPSDPPYVGIIGSKGLDEKRQKCLCANLHEQACELASYLMLVALCEEAAETLTSMNHPEGDCPLCLYPLVPDGDHSKSLPFMKLMSCFHCFHCECIIRWLKWIRNQNEANSETSSALSSAIGEENQKASDVCEMMGDSTGNCPVCRKVFLAKDIEHVLNSIDCRDVDTDADEKELREKLLQCDLEKGRRERFEEILDLQQQRGGLIEPPKDNVLFSRISIQDLVQEAEMAANGEAVEQRNGDQTAGEEHNKHQNDARNQSHEGGNQRQSGRSGSASGSRGRSHAGQRRHSGTRKHGVGRGGNSRPQTMQWTRKD